MVLRRRGLGVPSRRPPRPGQGVRGAEGILRLWVRRRLRTRRRLGREAGAAVDTAGVLHRHRQERRCFFMFLKAVPSNRLGVAAYPGFFLSLGSNPKKTLISR